MKKIADDITRNLALNFRLYEEIMKNKTEKKDFCRRLYDIKESLPKVTPAEKEIAKKAAEAQKIIKQQAFLESVKNKKSTLVFDGKFMAYENVMDYKSLDKNGVTLYNLYKNAVSEKGMEEIGNSLLGKNYKTTDEFMADFAKAIMLGALRNPKMNGIGYISDTLTKENADAVGIDISNYLKLGDKSAANKEIAKLNITSLEELESFIKNYKESGKSSQTSSGKGTGSSGGVSGGGVVVTDAKVLEEKKEAEFSDVSKTHWAYDAICELYKKGVVSGKGANKFLPDEKITRAEFVKMLCVLNDIKAEETDVIFSDVTKDDWYFEYVGAAYKLGWIKGVDDKSFGPNKYISRQDICTLLYRMGNIQKSDKAEFIDSADISEYAKEAVASLAANKVLTGFPDGSFRPKESCTRAQAAKLLYELYK